MGTQVQVPDGHKFKQDSGMTFEEVYGFAFDFLIPLLRNLGGELDREDYIELLQKAACDAGAANTRKYAESLPSNDFETWCSWTRELLVIRFWKDVLTGEIVEETDTAIELKVTECLWAKTFRERDAADIGYATSCHPDYATCVAFNPKIRMIRTKTLMQGDECCNHRYVWED